METNDALYQIIKKNEHLNIDENDEIYAHDGNFYVLISTRVVYDNLFCFNRNWQLLWRLNTKATLVQSFDPTTMTAHMQSGADITINRNGDIVKIVSDH